ncbi:unnamed protein product [Leptidea sinapis]|uniref:Uncharacterized protein n=1 Tax=Leptidea sinapis TaxID=189913 RepID=A0A5E4QPA2_9NEOP|nr:unnamed protein product [Leptidea sinapis]
MSDAWEEIQAVKSKRNSLREKLEKRKKERQSILASNLGVDKRDGSPSGKERIVCTAATKCEPSPPEKPKLPVPPASLEVRLLQVLSDMQLQLPATASALMPGLGDVDTGIVASLLQKFATQKLINIKERTESTTDANIEVVSAESVRLAAVLAALMEEQSNGSNAKRKDDTENVDGPKPKVSKTNAEEKKVGKGDSDIMKAVKRVGEEIMDLLSAQVMEFCPHGTRADCVRSFKSQDGDLKDKHTQYTCKKLHFKKIIQGHTDDRMEC